MLRGNESSALQGDLCLWFHRSWKLPEACYSQEVLETVVRVDPYLNQGSGQPVCNHSLLSTLKKEELWSFNTSVY